LNEGEKLLKIPRLVFPYHFHCQNCGSKAELVSKERLESHFLTEALEYLEEMEKRFHGKHHLMLNLKMSFASSGKGKKGIGKRIKSL